MPGSGVVPSIRKAAKADKEAVFVVLDDPVEEGIVRGVEKSLAECQTSLDKLAGKSPKNEVALAIRKTNYNIQLVGLRELYACYNLKSKSREFHRTMPKGWNHKMKFTLSEARALVAYYSKRVETITEDVETCTKLLSEAMEILAPLEAADRIF